MFRGVQIGSEGQYFQIQIGTGCGVSTAWIASATSFDVYIIDNDQDRAMGTRDLFSKLPHVHSICGDWEKILQQGPFQFVFVDAKPAKLEGIDKVINATEIGGFIETAWLRVSTTAVIGPKQPWATFLMLTPLSHKRFED